MKSVHDQRCFYGISFIAPNISSCADVKNFFSTNPIDSGFEIHHEEKDVEAKHYLYYTETQYSDSPIVKATENKIPGKKLFELSFYVVCFKADGHNITIIASPFSKLTQDLSSHIQKKENDIRYTKINLKKLITGITEDSFEEENVKLTQYHFATFGDHRIGAFEIRGDDPLHTEQYSLLRNSFTRQNIGVIPQRVKLRHDDLTGHRISIQFDKYGNFSFHVSSQGSNLLGTKSLFTYLSKQKLFDLSPVSPASRIIESE